PTARTTPARKTSPRCGRAARPSWPRTCALLAEPMLVPPLPPAPAADPTDEVLATGRALAEGFREHGHALLAAVLDALERKVLNGGSYKAAWIQPFWEDLAAWCEGGDYSAPLDDRLERFTVQAMRDKADSAQVG